MELGIAGEDGDARAVRPAGPAARRAPGRLRGAPRSVPAMVAASLRRDPRGRKPARIAFVDRRRSALLEPSIPPREEKRPDVDYKDTVNLPKTDFPMKANLPQREPEILKRVGGAGRSSRSWWRRTRPARAQALRPARRAALRQRRHPHRPRAQQDPEGPHRQVPQPWRATWPTTCRAGTATACPSSGRSTRSWARRSATWTAPAVIGAAAPTPRKWIDKQREAFKRLGVFGRWDDALPHHGPALRGRHRPRAGARRPSRASSTAARSRSTGAPPTAPRSPRRRSSTRTTPRPRSTWPSTWSGDAARPPALAGRRGAARHLDHHPLDAARQPGGGGPPRLRLRGLRPRRRRWWWSRRTCSPLPRRVAPGELVGRRRRRTRPRPRGPPAAAVAAWPTGRPGRVLATLEGKELEGLRYRHPFMDRDLPGDPGRARHARGRHRPRPHRAGPRPGGLPGRREVRPRDPEPGRRRRPLHRGGRQVRRQGDLRGQRRDRGRPARLRAPALRPQGLAPPQLPALLALPQAGGLPRHRPVVPLARARRAARAHAGRDRPGPVDPALGPRPHLQHDREPPRLVPLAPAHLGRAHPGLLLRGVRASRSSPRRSCGASPTPSRRRGSRPGTATPRPHFIQGETCAAVRRGRLPARAGHPRRLVGLRRLLGGRGRARPEHGRSRSTSTWRAPTSTAAGSTPRSSPPWPSAGARPTGRCSPTASSSTGRGGPCRRASATGGAGGDHQEVRRRRAAPLGGGLRLPRRRAGLRPRSSTASPRATARSATPSAGRSGTWPASTRRRTPCRWRSWSPSTAGPGAPRRRGRTRSRRPTPTTSSTWPTTPPCSSASVDPLGRSTSTSSKDRLYTARRDGKARRSGPDAAPHGGAGPAPHAGAGPLLHRRARPGATCPAGPAEIVFLAGLPAPQGPGRRRRARGALRPAPRGAGRGAEGAGAGAPGRSSSARASRRRSP